MGVSRQQAITILSEMKTNKSGSYIYSDAIEYEAHVSRNAAIDLAISDMKKAEELEEKTLDILTDKQNIETDYAVFMDDYNEIKVAKERDEAIIERLTASIASKRMLVDGLLGENKRLKDTIENIKTEIKNKSGLDKSNVDGVLEIIDRYMKEC